MLDINADKNHIDDWSVRVLDGIGNVEEEIRA
jgi:hypothetical protein